MSLVLKSNVAFSGVNSVGAGFDEYKTRVEADGGTIINENNTRLAFTVLAPFLKQNKLITIINASWGVKVSGGYIQKFYSLTGADYDFRLTTGLGGQLKVSGLNGRNAMLVSGYGEIRYEMPKSVILPQDYGVVLNKTGDSAVVTSALEHALFIRKVGVTGNIQTDKLGALFLASSEENYQQKILIGNRHSTYQTSTASQIYSFGMFATKYEVLYYTDKVVHVTGLSKKAMDEQEVQVTLANPDRVSAPYIPSRGLYYGLVVSKGLDKNNAIRLADIMRNFM